MRVRGEQGWGGKDALGGMGMGTGCDGIGTDTGWEHVWL